MISNDWQTSLGKSITILCTTVLLASRFASRADGPSQPAVNSAPAPQSAQALRSRPGKVEAFALIGTGSYPGGAVACFDGNSAEFKTSAHPGERIGDCTVTAVSFDHVKLRSGSREIDLPMAMQLRRENDGQWQLLALTERFTPANETSAREFRPSAPAVFVPPPSEERGVEEFGRGLSSKQLRKLEHPPEDSMDSGKSGKSSKRERAAEADFIKRVEKAVRGDEKRLLREQ